MHQVSEKFVTVQQEGTVATALLRNLTGKGRGMGETSREILRPLQVTKPWGTSQAELDG